MAAVEYLEQVLASVENTMSPPLPVTGKPANLDIAAMLNKPGQNMTPSKKAWNRGVAISGSASATSPSAASTQTPGAQSSLDGPMSVSPCSTADGKEEFIPSENHKELQTLAEQYAQAKKQHSGEELASALECIASSCKCHSICDTVWETDAEPEARISKVEAALRETAQPYLPIVEGEATSIGSIAHFHGGIACCVGLCRFHVKGKCFDGALCRFCHISRDEHLREGVLSTGRSREAGRLANSPGDMEARDEGSSRRRRKGQKNLPLSPARVFTPPKAPLAAPLMNLPMPMPMMPMMHMQQMPMPMPMPSSSSKPAKPASKEQAALCELLSSLKVEPEQQHLNSMSGMNSMMYQPMPVMPSPMMPYGYGYDPAMYGYGYGMQGMQACPTVPHVQSLQAQSRRNGGKGNKKMY